MDTAYYMNKICEAIEYAQRDGVVTAYNWNETLKNKNVIAFGVGQFFSDTHNRLFEKVDIKYVCDNDRAKWGKEFFGKVCISPSELKTIEDVFVITVMDDGREVEKQLKEMEVESMPITELHFSAYEKGIDCTWLKKALPLIEKAIECLDDDKSKEIFTKVFLNKIYLSKYAERYSDFAEGGDYFYNEFWKLSDKEYFVDGGAYVGDTIAEFAQATDGKFEKIYSFEYENKNYYELSNNVEQKYPQWAEKIELYPYGIWNCKEDGWCNYFGESDGTQLVSQDCGVKCQLDKLDSVLEGKTVTTLKLDIEGAEMQGLEGAKNILATQKPKLAICLYHRPEDLWEVPLKIREINPNYKMIIKHHKETCYTDTILYAK